MATTKNVASGTHATNIGTVKSIVGTVTATDTSGVTRTLEVGDKVYANEIIQTSDSGAVLIEFQNGTHADLGRNSSLTLDLDVFNPAQAASEQSDINSIQAQIAAGADPTQITDASAAGAGAGDEGGSSFVVIDQLAAQGNVTSGFATTGIGAAFQQSSGLLHDTPPPVAADDKNNVVEDDFIAANGNVLTNDVSLSGGGLAVTGIPAGSNVTLEGQYGTLVINSDGSYTYTLHNASPTIQSLTEGQQVEDVFNYVANDGIKDSNLATLTITVTGTNDVPVATANTNSLFEDGTSVTGNLITDNNGFGVDSDADANAVITVTNVSGGDQHGVLTFNADGSYSYTLDNSDPAVQALGVGQFMTEVYTYTLTDDLGASDTATLTITISGTNDDPIATANLNSISEDGSSVSGNMITDNDGFGVDHDVDANAVLSVTNVNGGNTYGTLSFNSDGSYTYHLNSDNPTVQALNDGQTLTEVYTYTLSDGEGGFDTATVTITILGSADNSSPIAVKNVDSMTAEDVSVSGNMITDNDGFGIDSDPNGDPLTVISVSGTGAHGTLEFNSNGTYTYTLNPQDETVSALAHGETLTETFTYTISDGNGGTDSANLSIVISGTNHEPIATANFNAVSEDGGNALTASGNMINDNDGLGQDSDADGDTLTVTNVSGGNEFGSLSFDGNGSYTYTLHNSNSDVQALGAEQTLTETYTYTISDGAGGFDSASLTITISGTNDAPVATVNFNSIEKTGASVSGNMISDNDGFGVDHDTDANATLTISAVDGGNAHGTLTFDSDGSYTYTVNGNDEAVLGLGHGQSLVDTYTYTLSDGAGGSDTATLTISITGVNDAPVATANVNSIAEDAVSVSGNMITDNDGSGVDHDINAEDTLSVSAVTGGDAHGTLSFGADGSYTYAIDNTDPAVQALGVGQSLTDTYTYTLSDNAGGSDTATLTITITGTNDEPVATANVNTIAQNDVSVSGNLISDDDGFGVDHDTDANAVLTVSDVAGDNAHGTLTFGSNGSYTYTVDNDDSAVQALGVGQSLVEIYTYTLTDDQGASDTATLTITITGTNDDPVATANLNTVAEDGSSVSGNMITDDDGFGVDSDTDANAVLSVLTVTDVIGGNAHGTLSFDSDGSYTYAIDNTDAAVQALGVGQSLTDTYTYTLSDGAGGSDTATLTITINGTNDAPVATANTAAIAEGAASVSGNMVSDNNGFGVDHDTDANAVLTVSAVSGGDAHGTLTFGSNGSYTYAIDNTDPAVQALGVGQSLVETYIYTLTDDQGASDTATLTITINGTNDAPVATANTAAIAEDAVSVSGNMITDNNGFGVDHDTDANAVLTVSAVSGGDAHGTLTFGSNGSYTYALDNTDAAVQALGVGQSLVETYTYTLSDGAGGSDTATLTVTINGTNDAPVATANTNAIAENAVSVSGNMITDNSGFGVDHDTDANAVLTVSAVSGGDAHGTLTFGSNGSYTYAIDNTDLAVQALGVGQSLIETYTYTLSDGAGGSDTATLTVTINGTNDAPVATANTATIAEDAVSVSGNMITDNNGFGVDHDTDANAVLTVSAVSGGDAHGTLTFGSNGSYTYTLNNSDPLVQGLGVTESLVETYTYTLSDGAGGSDTATLTVTINGTNDAPTVDAMKTVFMPDGNDQMVGSYQNGYALSLNAPADIDGDSLTITVGSLPTVGQVGYVDGLGFHSITSIGQVLTQAQFLSLTYKPDGVATYGTDGSPISGANSTTFTYSVSDGTTSVAGTVNLQTLLGTGAHTDTVQIGDGSHPLTSGSDQTVNYVVSQALADESSFSNGALYLKTDFHVLSTKNLTSQVENQVTAKVVVDGHEFIAISANNGVTDWTQHGTNANSGGYWDTTVLFTNMTTTINGSQVSLASYLGSHPPAAGSTWTVIYDDTTPGSEQARYLSASFINDIDGTPAVSTVGTSGIDLIYGTTAGGDSLSGSAGNDTIIAREGNDSLNGDSGNDILVGNGGNDILVGGLGNDIMTGGDGHDTFVFNSNSYSTPGSDAINDFTIGNPTSTANGDILKISDVLTAAHSEHSAIPTDIAQAINGGFLTVQPTATATSVNIVLDLDGTGGSSSSIQVVTLHNIPVADQATLLTTLLNNQELT